MEKKLRGIILAGGKGTRLQPATLTMNKHMVPILNKPMILYPVETLKSLGIVDILIVSGGNHIGGFADFLGDGSEYGINLTYRVQKEAGGIAQALWLAKSFAQYDPVAVILGDNIFDNESFLKNPIKMEDKAILFTKMSPTPERFGVLFRGEDLHIEEKPDNIRGSAEVVTGLYMYPTDVFDMIPSLSPSDRGELEVSEINNWYIERDRMDAHLLKGFWSDAGTPKSLYEATVWASKQISTD